MAQFAYACHHIDSEPPLTGRRTEVWLSGPEEVEEDMKEAIEYALTQFKMLAVDARYNQGLKMNKRVAPVEFVFIGESIVIICAGSNLTSNY